VWDGYNIAAEIVIDEVAPSTNVTYYTWGLDLSGTLQGAGGVGGLLAVTTADLDQPDSLTTYYPCYDANGNITEYVDAAGNIRAHYEYSPFGEIVVQSGDLADTFTHRFSTKPFDAETSLVMYQLRPYASGLGRFLSRDPVQEEGGINLYGICANNGVNKADPFGLLSWDDLVGTYNKARAALKTAEQCMKTVRDAFKRRDQRYGDKLNHCLSSCEISIDCGQNIADALGTLKEARDLFAGWLEWGLAWVIPKSWEEWVSDHIQGGSFQDSVDDFVANFTGFGCKDNPAGCECCCRKKYE